MEVKEGNLSTCTCMSSGINLFVPLPPLQARVMKTGEMVALKIIKIEPGKP